MEEKNLTKRTIWVVECDCTPEDPYRKVYPENPPREHKCPRCDKWHEPKEESYIGKDKFHTT